MCCGTCGGKDLDMTERLNSLKNSTVSVAAEMPKKERKNKLKMPFWFGDMRTADDEGKSGFHCN